MGICTLYLHLKILFRARWDLKYYFFVSTCIKFFSEITMIRKIKVFGNIFFPNFRNINLNKRF